MKPTEIYWCILEPLDFVWSLKNLILSSHSSMFAEHVEIMKQEPTRGQKHLVCPAHRATKSNVFLMRFPFSANLFFDDKGDWKIDPSDDLKKYFAIFPSQNFESNYVPRITFTFKFPMLFLSKESVEIELLPAYLHKTIASQHGHITTGKFDISKWIRPINWEFILWQDEREFHCKKDEPAFYIKFHAQSPVLLKQFRPSQLIQGISASCVDYVNLNPHKTLHERYEHLSRTKLAKLAMREALANLV